MIDFLVRVFNRRPLCVPALRGFFFATSLAWLKFNISKKWVYVNPFLVKKLHFYLLSIIVQITKNKTMITKTMKELIETKYGFNNAQVVVIKAIHNLSTEEIAEITGYSSRSVSNWLCRPDSNNHRRAPDKAVKKLRGIYSLEFR
ncbi:RNA polymerase sigma factor sigma-70 region 4 domain-containing protein [Piscirickettsia litoralis]|uniref:HTH cro/C1-type domain-containing protein n=1 Tax=Piscirickettsia litoralis TaxID=1891921 RepID=A0ABX3A0P4_9GAMM|nr:sigma-70 region 4 domain-containing protein [Piscirickettsia litoralis]ODN41198.1 hypothetical protein BGC07_17445 [Piscirickettsia litoralis]